MWEDFSRSFKRNVTEYWNYIGHLDNSILRRYENSFIREIFVSFSEFLPLRCNQINEIVSLSILEYLLENFFKGFKKRMLK